MDPYMDRDWLVEWPEICRVCGITEEEERAFVLELPSLSFSLGDGARKSMREEQRRAAQFYS